MSTMWDPYMAFMVFGRSLKFMISLFVTLAEAKIYVS